MLATVIAPSRAYAILLHLPAAGFDPGAFGHDDPVTPDERAPFIRGRFLPRQVLSQKLVPTDEGPGFPGPSRFWGPGFRIFRPGSAFTDGAYNLSRCRSALGNSPINGVAIGAMPVRKSAYPGRFA